jgi:hypothetical protein
VARRKPKEDPQNALLGDLESIRTLLDDEDDGDELQPKAGKELDNVEVPVLEDVVEDAAQGAKASADLGASAEDRAEEHAEDTAEGTQPDTGSAPATEEFGLDDDLFRALLSDEWRDSASEILKEAREAIGEHRTDWTPEETDALNDALKVRIDQTMQGWMRGMVVTHMADLHTMLLKELSTELRSAIDNIIGLRNEGRESNKRNERSDGK